MDNQKVFEEALGNGRRKEYCITSFAGDFGHYTKKGNRLIAENLARVIKGIVSDGAGR